MIRRLGLGKSIARSFSSAEPATSKITIKPSVERSPTDLLKALSSTVGVDTTAPHFAFIDDPITIPSTQSAKKTYFMAKELGKRAARELATEWPTLFSFDRDQPRLPAFRPSKLADPLQVEPTEQNLIKMIESKEVQDSCILYERIRSENIDVSETTQVLLFRLVSYYNSTNIPFAEWAEWSGMRNFGEVDQESWKSGAVADLLFETLPRTDETVSIMISGLCKFPNEESVKRAKSLYNEHRESGGQIRREAFNNLISNLTFQNAQKLCIEMEKSSVRPDVSTFNSLLISASKLGKFEERVRAFTEVLSEMRNSNVEAALSSYHLILRNLIDQKLLVDGNRDEKMNKLYSHQLKLAISWVSEILDSIDGKQLEVSSKLCNLFFSEAMGIAYRAANLDVAQRLLKVYESENNKVIMPAFTIESIFYNRYLQLFIEQSNSIENIYNTYKAFVPRLVGVSNSLSSSVYRKLSRQPHWPLLRRVIEDGIASGQMTTMIGEDMRKHLISVQYHALNVSERDEYREIIQKLVATWIEFSQFTEEYAKRLQRKLFPSQISDCALLLTRIGENQKAYELLEMILDEEAASGDDATVMSRGYARPTSMAELFEDALRRKDQQTAALCLEIISLNMNGSKLQPLANRLIERCNLTDAQTRIIQGYVRLRPQ